VGRKEGRIESLYSCKKGTDKQQQLRTNTPLIDKIKIKRNSPGNDGRTRVLVCAYCNDKTIQEKRKSAILTTMKKGDGTRRTDDNQSAKKKMELKRESGKKTTKTEKRAVLFFPLSISISLSLC
jgi:hypothetical protein